MVGQQLILDGLALVDVLPLHGVGLHLEQVVHCMSLGSNDAEIF